MLVVEHCSFAHINLVALLARFDHLDIVSELALQTNISNEAEPRFRINAWHITHVGVAIRIPIGHVEQKDEFDAVGEGSHVLLLLGLVAAVVAYLGDLLRAASETRLALMVIANKKETLLVRIELWWKVADTVAE